jgi:biopolymer transport protein ExbB
MTHPLKTLLASLLAVLVLSSSAHAWWNDGWTIRKKITIDTTATGGAISDPIGTTPVLLRLDDGNFQFAAAKDDGSDIRVIAGDDKTPLTYHLEKYDALLNEAFLWVKVPDLKPGDTTTLYLYYGNTGDKPGPGAADEKGTYDGDTILVYHFADAGKPAHDSTSLGNDAHNAGLGSDSSLIGPGLRFDGKAAPVSILTSSSLNWTAGQALTWSAWIKPTALSPNEVIYSRRDGGNDFIVGLDNGLPFVDLNGTRSPGAAPLAAGTWHHLAVVASGSTITLYVDGAAYGTLNASLPALNSTAYLGGDSPDAGANLAAFTGELDELEISKVARPVGFLKAEAIGQGGDSASKFLTIGPDESPPASWLSGSLGLFGVIIKSVTIDGWVVIGILGLMSVVSWFVMITKFFHLLKVEKGDAYFLKEWRQVALDLTVLDHSNPDNVKSMGGRVKPKVMQLIRKAPLYRIYHIGSEEIAHRVSGGRNISSRSIQAIRASLDGGYVRENHALNSGMVFLTISIAGGPFMGLLGTCIGVMITFAAIAATGEVNISAIAPGLAAALVATVAGLLVAIPALLGYNYLTSRMKTITSDMQIFVDEFVTKMAEFYSDEKIEKN